MVLKMSEYHKNIDEKSIDGENICCCNHDHHNENKFNIQVDHTGYCEESCEGYPMSGKFV